MGRSFPSFFDATPSFVQCEVILHAAGTIPAEPRASGDFGCVVVRFPSAERESPEQSASGGVAVCLRPASKYTLTDSGTRTLQVSSTSAQNQSFVCPAPVAS
jgi:hypothetical protein